MNVKLEECSLRVMKMVPQTGEIIHLWNDRKIMGGMEMLKARCFEHHYAPHSHETFVIASFKDGAQKHRIAEKRGIAYPGTVMVIPPGEVHTGEGANRKEAWEYTAFYPTADCLEQIADELFGDTRGSLDFGTSFLIEDEQLAKQLQMASDIAMTSLSLIHRQEAVYSAFAMLVTRYGRRARQLPAQTLPDAPIEAGLYFMKENFHLPLSMNDIAQAVGLSEFHFMRLFKARTKITVHQQLKQIRLAAAKALLSEGEAISKVASSVGFYDQSHFTNSFRRAYGVTPKKFAAACR